MADLQKHELQMESLKEELKEYRKEQRKVIAGELRIARKKLREYQMRAAKLNVEHEDLVRNIRRQIRQNLSVRLRRAKERLRTLDERRMKARQEIEEFRDRKRAAMETVAEERNQRKIHEREIFLEWWKTITGQFHQLSGDGESYPSYSTPVFNFKERRKNLPSCPGIYFLWKDGVIEYVGQAVNLSSRLGGGHHILKEYHSISFVPVSREDLNWAESYYIGIIRPVLNYGRRRNGNGNNAIEGEQANVRTPEEGFPASR